MTTSNQFNDNSLTKKKRNKHSVELIKIMRSGNYRINNHHKLIQAYGKDKIKPSLLIKLKQESLFYKIWFSIFSVLGAILLIIEPTNILSVFDLFIVMINIYLVAKRKVIGIYVGLLECVVYGLICLFNGLYGEVINAFLLYTPIYIYDIVSWTISLKKQKENNVSSEEDNELKVHKLSKKQLTFYVLSTIAIFVASYTLLKYVIKQENALIFSALSMAISIIGEIMIARCFMESYIPLFLGELVGLLIWVQTMIETSLTMESITMIVYYFATISNNLYGHLLWRDIYRKVAIKHGVLLNKRKVNIKKIIKLKRQFRSLHWDKKVDISKNS